MTHGWALQKAVFLALTGDGGVKAELGDPPRLYDDPPPDAAFPYALLGEARTASLAGADDAFEHQLTLRVVSRHGGRREVKRAMNAIHDALHDAPLAVEGVRLVSLRFVFADIFRREAALYTGAMRFRAVTQTL